MVAEILARDVSEVAYRLHFLLQRLGPVDEQVAQPALEQERADPERRTEPKRFGFRGVQARHHGIHESTSPSPVDLASLARREANRVASSPTCHTSSPACKVAFGPLPGTSVVHA